MHFYTLIFVLVASLFLFSNSSSAQLSSENHEKLRAAFEQYPDADSNGDGVLTWAEAKQYRDHTLRRGKVKGGAAQLSYSVQPTHPEIAYGPYERNRLDLWQAVVSEPAPIIIYIHGGGYIGGSKEKADRVTFIQQALQDGVHFASINYRYKYRSEADLSDSQRTGLPGCFLDGARAIQYLRANAEEWNIDPTRVIVFGGSAGGGISLFLGVNDDLADPDSEDPVLRESSRVCAVGHFSSQPTLNFAKWPEILGMSESELKGVTSAAKQNIPEHVNLGLSAEADVESPLGLRYRSMIDMSANIDTGDSPVFIYNNSVMRAPQNHGEAVHHIKLSMYLDEQLKAHGVPSTCLFPRLDGLQQVEPYAEFYAWCRTVWAL